MTRPTNLLSEQRFGIRAVARPAFTDPATVLLFALLAISLAALRADASTFKATLTDGTNLEGKLIGWTNDRITIAGSEQSVVEIEKLANLSQVDAFSDAGGQPNLTSRAWVGLTDGSALLVRSFALSSDGRDATATMTLQGTALSVGTDDLQFVRFRSPSPELAKQWQELADSRHDGDALVIRRSNTSLDYLEGIVRQMSATHVEFEFDGDTIDVEIKKLEGIVFFHNETATRKTPTMRIQVGNESTLHAQTVDLIGTTLAIKTDSGANFKLPLDQLTRVDFTSGRVTYLSDLKPLRMKYQPAIGGDVAKTTNASLAKLLYSPRNDVSFSGTSLTLSFPNEAIEKTYPRGLALHSRTEVTYRLGKEFSRLKGLAGLDPHPSRSGSVLLSFQLDGKQIWQQTIYRQHDPIPLDLDVDGAARLTIVVDYGEDGDFGDRLHLCSLRVIK